MVHVEIRASSWMETRGTWSSYSRVKSEPAKKKLNKKKKKRKKKTAQSRKNKQPEWREGRRKALRRGIDDKTMSGDNNQLRGLAVTDKEALLGSKVSSEVCPPLSRFNLNTRDQVRKGSIVANLRAQLARFALLQAGKTETSGDDRRAVQRITYARILSSETMRNGI
ncbi:uncharacterized protein BO97DRAFT_144732 [Aspergillus homomorphus CBS 101889]|uniref:Uncharacterized protein n=1 Tax=Aspergillus homomorphus (strain CBS 101889) TaxID=1450537 RepID=A0A395HQP0_ASPHC|nr:hypothetical protein BO97DRAFT_144732 [Aspergillus homomorphus CBS 101889]RAL10262.1 hypothetical protein BO97DRAFT_144732 [Aspergillus homomorphus CBS 101889]